jgi:ABC-type dipeptide/oligopeptide/nickel transport system ATPase subunit
LNAPVRTFEAKPAVRESVPLLIGLMGCSGSGKTFSALRLATGIQEITGGDIFFIDTEARRALHYADQFKFRHVQFDAPFGSLDYLAAIQSCVQQGAKVIVVDSMTHEHTGPGGYLLTQEAEVDRMAGNDYAKRERVKMAGWIKPSGLRQQMISGILQLNANMVFCFRAKEKTKPVKGGGIQELGFMPVAGEELLFEQTVNCLLMPKSDGVPTWRSDQPGEKMMMKLPKQFESIFADQKPLDEETGRQLAAWARGGASSSPSGSTDRKASQAAPTLTQVGAVAGSDVPTAHEYARRWHTTLDAATPSRAKQITDEWNAEKTVRREITWPDDDTLTVLIDRVKNVLEDLRK